MMRKLNPKSLRPGALETGINPSTENASFRAEAFRQFNNLNLGYYDSQRPRKGEAETRFGEAAVQTFIFGDGLTAYYFRPESLGIDPEQFTFNREEWNLFLMVESIAALVYDPDSKGTAQKMFLVDLHHERNSSLPPIINYLNHADATQYPYAIYEYAELKGGLILRVRDDAREIMMKMLTTKKGVVPIAPLRQAGIDPKMMVDSMVIFPARVEKTIALPTTWNAADFLQPLPGESEDEFQARVIYIKNPLEIQQIVHEMSDLLQEALRGEYVTLKGVVFFCSFWVQLNPEDRSQLLRAYKEGLAAYDLGDESITRNSFTHRFINAFSVCERGWHLGKDLLKIMRAENMDWRTLDRCEHILMFRQKLLGRPCEGALEYVDAIRGEFWNIQGEELKAVFHTLHDSLDREIFLTTIGQIRAELIHAAANGELKENFNIRDVLWGAFFKAIMAKKPLLQAKGALEMLLGGHTIEVTQGATLKEDEKEQLEEYIQEVYSDIDPAYGALLIRRLESELNDPTITWVTLRQADTLIGTCKIHPERDKETGQIIPNHYYIGTLYVNPDFRTYYDVGKVLKDLALSTLPPGAIVSGNVAVSNPAIKTLLNENWIGTAITTDKDDEVESGPLVKLCSSDFTYPSQTMSRRDLFQQYSPSTETDFSSPTHILQADSRPQNKPAYSQLLHACFEKNYVLTRVFYEQNEAGKLDLEKTYVVFEKKAA